MSTAQSTLTAKPSAAVALLKNHLGSRLQGIRCLVEADPGCGQMSRLRKAEQHWLSRRYTDAALEAEHIEAALTARAEALVVGNGMAETISLAQARGETVDTDRAGSTRILNRDGLLWLKQKKRMSQAEMAALERYRDLYERAHAGPTGSSWNAAGGGGAGMGPKAEVRAQAIWELDDARKAVCHDEQMIRLLDQVAGLGVTLRDLGQGQKDAVNSLETELRVAARLLARCFGFRA